MIKEPRIQMFDLLNCLSSAMDLVNPRLVNHHKQVAYVALCIARELNLPADQQTDLVYAGLLHDIGAISLAEKLQALQFEFENPQKHAELGYMLIKVYEPFARIAPLIRFHHVPWDEGYGAEFNGEKVPFGSHILHLADRIAISVQKEEDIFGQEKDVISKIEEHTTDMFVPELVAISKDLIQREYFMLDLTSNSIGTILSNMIVLPTIEENIDGLLSLARLFAHVIDFRSRFTSTHSSGVATTAKLLAEYAGLSQRQCKMMEFAGYVHDLGKLAVPPEILEKPAKLTSEEFNMIKKHTYYTYRALEPIADLKDINMWASFHHERLNGSGYPFHHKGENLVLEARIMAVADIFTAITEDRPYRKGMPDEKALHVIEQMANDSFIDSNVVSLLKLHFDEINTARKAAQAASSVEYERLLKVTN